MSSNAPPFDPLKPTQAEDDAMMAGYLDGYNDRPTPRQYEDSLPYAHGRRNGVNDRNRTTDAEGRALARRAIREGALNVRSSKGE